jgi:hypothetical protein
LFRGALVLVTLCIAEQAQALTRLRADAACTNLNASNSDVQYVRFWAVLDNTDLKIAIENMK